MGAFISKQIEMYELDYSLAIQKIQDKYNSIFTIKYEVVTNKEKTCGITYYMSKATIIVVIRDNVRTYSTYDKSINCEESVRLALKNSLRELVSDRFLYYGLIDNRRIV